MKELRIQVDIDREGRITADAEGFSGDACIKDLERLLEGLAPAWERIDRKQGPRDAVLSTTAGQSVGAGRKP